MGHVRAIAQAGLPVLLEAPFPLVERLARDAEVPAGARDIAHRGRPDTTAATARLLTGCALLWSSRLHSRLVGQERRAECVTSGLRIHIAHPAPQAGLEPATLRLTGGKRSASRRLPLLASHCRDERFRS